MPNSFDFDPRGPSNRRLFFLGVCFIVIAAVAAVAAIAKSNGRFDNLVPIDVEMANVGDGLPARSDVKFRGVLVGAVSDITPARYGRPNVVHVTLYPQYAAGIPDSVTARVVPSNAFAVSAIQLVDNGIGSGPLQPGSVVREDQTLPTVLFQNVLAKARELLAAVGRKPDDNTIGVLAAFSEATHGRGQQLSDAGHDLNEILAQLNTVVAGDDTGPTMLSALTAAADGLHNASPELFDALDSSIRPMQTMAEKRSQLNDFLSAGLRTTGTLGDAFDHHTDRLITISTEMTPAIGVIADHAGEFHGISTRMQTFANKLYEEGWDPERRQIQFKAVAALTPTRTYVRADCPRYGALEGPSCKTAPESPTAPDLFPALESQGFTPTPGLSENRPNLTPPRHSMPGDPQGPLPPPGPPQEAPPPEAVPPPAPLPAEAPPPGEAQPQSASFGGNVGPVGSRQEAEQLGQIVGGEPTSADQLLLGPLARGTAVQITPEGGTDQ